MALLISWPHGAAAQRKVADGEALEIIHITDRINSLPTSRQALDTFSAARRNGVAGKTGGSGYEVGDRRTFKVYNHEESERRKRLVLEDLEFTAEAVDGRFVVWVDTEELSSGHVRPQDVDEFVAALLRSTPDGSIDASSGIIPNEERVFGTPPDVDGDGATDVLLLDIRDGWEPGSENGYVAGFVWAGDLTEAGNERDIVYIDTYPGLYRNGQHLGTKGIEATVAHEFLHLIHLNYDTNEITFVDEGLAEWATALNGYPGRRITYLEDIDEHNVPLYDWRSGADVFGDYQRAGLFTSYLAQRIGVEATGSIVRQRRQGSEGYERALSNADLSLSDVITNFHVANLLNDGALGAEFGHALTSRSSLRAVPTYIFDAAVPGVTTIEDHALNAGAVQYFEWTNVSNLVASIDVDAASVAPSLVPVHRKRVSVRLIVEDRRGSTFVQAAAVGPEPITVSEGAARVVLVVVHHAPDEYGVRLNLHASWTDVATDTDVTRELPNELLLEQNYPNPFNPQTIVRYTIPSAGHVRLTIFDGLGRIMARPVDDVRSSGRHEVVVDGSAWVSGMYVYRLETAGRMLTRQMTFLR